MDWSTSPADILLLIFENLDHKSLLNCLSVCMSWRDAVDYHAGVKGIWPKLAQLAMYNKGTAFKQRSILSWRNLYFNYQLWKNGNVCFQVDKILKLNQFKHMNVFEDNLFVILDSGMKQYKIDTLELCSEDKGVVDFQQTKHMTGKLVDGSILFLKIENREKEFSITCCNFRLIENRCLTIDAKNALSLIEIDADNLMHTTLMRCYDPFGSICSTNIYLDEVYVLKRNGTIIRAEFVMTVVGKINSPHFYNNPTVMCLFLKHSVVYSVRSEEGSESLNVTEIGDTGEIAVECSGLSCVTPYGDILLLGFEDGEVRVYLSKKMMNTKEPLFTFNIKDVLNSVVNTAVKAIEVYEANESHYLFVATEHELIKVIVTID